jgi:uncharacterized membrane protein
MDIEIILQIITKNLFGIICHQDPSVLMKINGKVFLLCPRCVGLHLGFLYTFLLTAVYTKKQTRIQGKYSILIIIIAIGLMLTDWTLGQIGLFTPTNTTRLVTGTLGGASLAILAITYYRETVHISSSTICNFREIHIISFMYVSLCASTLIILFSNWTVLSLVMAICIVINAIIAIYMVFTKISRLLGANINLKKKDCYE